jgi:hypothetical protein
MVQPLHNKLLADATFKLQGSGVPVTSEEGAVTSLDTIISNAIGILTLIAVVFFAIQIIFAGYGFLASQGDPKKLEMARTRLTNGILGLVIVIIALGFTALISSLLGIEGAFNLETIISTLTFTGAQQ